VGSKSGDKRTGNLCENYCKTLTFSNLEMRKMPSCNVKPEGKPISHKSDAPLNLRTDHARQSCGVRCFSLKVLPLSHLRVIIPKFPVEGIGSLADDVA
jgi:hypothetical protein